MAACSARSVASALASVRTSAKSVAPVARTSVLGTSFVAGATPAFARLRTAACSPKSSSGYGLRTFTVRAADVGDKLPPGEFAYFDKEGNSQKISVEDLTKGKKVVIFAVPGAFTPTCSLKHLPSFVEKADELKAKGVDTIACVSVNDPFVLKAWGEQVGTGDKVLLLADGAAKFTTALGAAVDWSDNGFGVRSRRYALLADDGVIKTFNLEEGGKFTFSGAEDILNVL